MSVADATDPAKDGALPPRTPTFLARYPRKLKLGAVGVMALMVALSWFVADHTNKVAQKTVVIKRETSVQGADKIIPEQEKKTAHAGGRSANGSGAAAVQNDQQDTAIKMAQAPDPGLTEDTAQGSLPRIGEDGRQPWQVYARPFNTADTRPRIAIVVVDLGQDRLASDAAIARLPANVTLAFDTMSPVTAAWCARARQDGHETLLSLPMEPFDYPRSDPGSNTLLTTLPNTDNIERLLAALRQGMGYVGITTTTGSRFTATPEKMRPVLEVLKARGLMVFDARVAPHSVVSDLAHDMHVASASETERLDTDLSPEGIEKSLDQLEKDARLNGSAVGITGPEPIMLERLQAWLKDLPGQGIALAPITAMVQ